MNMHAVTINTVAAAALALLAALAPMPARAQDASLYQQAVARMTPAQAAAGGDAAGLPGGPASLVATPKANPKTYTRNELITIIISESASHTSNGTLATERDASIDASLDSWVSLRLSGSDKVRPTTFGHGLPAVKGEAKRDFDGSGTSTRSDRLTARITGRIIDIRPNGSLVLEASKRITADEETYSITVTGTCRTEDVSPDNTVLSTALAELEIVKCSEGAIHDATKRSWIQRFLDFINIF